MNVKLLLSTLLVGIVAIACTEGVGASDPAQLNNTSTTEPGRNIATSVPATVSRIDTIDLTATSVSLSAVSPERPATVVPTSALPLFVPTATRTPFDPFATPTPLWASVPTPTSVPVATPQPTSTPVVLPTVYLAPSDRFQPKLDYQYSVPSGWSERITESSIVLTDGSGKLKVEITEAPVERWRYQTVIAMGATAFPERPGGWNTWSSKSVGVIKSGTAYEFQFTGVKNGVRYLQFIHWYMWGDIHVQVAVDVPEFDWNSSSSIRSVLGSVMDGFQPHDGTHLMTSQSILAVMYERLDDRASGVYMRNEALRMRYELTCREIYTDLLTVPEYLGTGLWQLTAQTLDGAETWWVFEPTGSVMTLNSNQSRC